MPPPKHARPGFTLGAAGLAAPAIVILSGQIQPTGQTPKSPIARASGWNLPIPAKSGFPNS
jgi:hypothetical protein